MGLRERVVIARKRRPGRPPTAAAKQRSVRRTVLLLPAEAAAQDRARGDQEWSSWVRGLIERTIQAAHDAGDL